jgi:hypothetical protein
MPGTTQAVLSAAILASVGCVQHDRITAPHNQFPSAPASATLTAHEAALVVYDLTPTVGNIVVVAGVLPLSDSLTLGSFVARLSYDPSKLHYLGESDPDEMMRVVNPESGKLTIAAAASGGSKTGRLFTFRFRADDPQGMATLVLSIDELNDARYASRLSLIRLASVLRVDKSLAPKRANTQ